MAFDYSNWFPFFVYGSLMPGQSNFYLWQAAVVQARPGQLYNARLYRLGQYPILVDYPEQVVQGVIIDLDHVDYLKTVQIVDQLEQFDPQQPEKGIYRRMIRPVLTARNEWIQAWVYVGDPLLTANLPSVIGNDWATQQNYDSQAIATTIFGQIARINSLKFRHFYLSQKD